MTTPKILLRQSVPCVGIEIKVTLREWGKANSQFPPLFQWVLENNGEIKGPPFYQYLVKGSLDKAFHIVAGVITATSMKGNGKIISSYLPDGKYLSYIHQGHPDRLEMSHEFLQHWAKDNSIDLYKEKTGKIEVWKGLYELYITKPDEEPDLNNWKTEILCLIK